MQEKKNPSKNWERNYFFCKEKLCIEWKSGWQIYAKRIIIRRKKVKKIKGKRKSDIKVEGLERWKGKGNGKGWRKCKIFNF